MKKLLLLFIPLMFFFSCELFNEEEEPPVDTSGYNCTLDGCLPVDSGAEYVTIEDCENICDCSCGEVVAGVYVNGYAGTISGIDYDGDGVYDQFVANNDDHAGYLIYYIKNYCDSRIGITYTSTEIGDSICVGDEYIWSDLTVNSQIDENCNNSTINENNTCGIISDVSIIMGSGGNTALGAIELTLENCITNKIGKACITVYDENDFFIYNNGDVYCPEEDNQSYWGEIIVINNLNPLGPPIAVEVCHTSSYQSYLWPDN